MNIINTEIIPLSKIVGNRGQLPGLPKNPRFIKDENFQKLVDSIAGQPDMLYLRELLVYPSGSKFIVIGGNMRHKAMKQLGMSEAPCKIIPPDTPVEQLKNILLKDNSSYGEWDTDALAFDWDSELVEDCAIDFGDDSDYTENVEKKRKAWKKGSRCSGAKSDLTPHYSFHKAMDRGYLSCFNVTKDGYSLYDIKENDDNIPVFAENAMGILRQLGLRDLSGYCIIAAPKRRHKEHNFADGVCEALSGMLQIPYYHDCIVSKNKNRVNPVFEFTPPTEKNIIFFDDILTTGSTMLHCNALMTDCNVINVIGINNH